MEFIYALIDFVSTPLIIIGAIVVVILVFAGIVAMFESMKERQFKRVLHHPVETYHFSTNRGKTSLQQMAELSASRGEQLEDLRKKNTELAARIAKLEETKKGKR